MGEAKPRSYRVDDETAAKIKEITDGIGEGQQVAFARMIEAYHMQQTKIALGDERANVEQFESHVSIINRMYLDAIESKNNMREMVRSEFEDMLRSKDEIIQDLQDKNRKMTQEKEDAKVRASEYQSENLRVNNENTELKRKNEDQRKDYLEKLKDKESLNETLTEAMTDLKQKNDSMKSTVEATERIQRENEGLHSEVAGLQARIEQMQKDAEQAQREAELKKVEALHEQQKEYEKQLSENKQEMLELKTKHMEQVEALQIKMQENKQEILDLRTKHMEQIEAVQSKMQEQIDKYQAKYMELLEKMGHNKN